MARFAEIDRGHQGLLSIRRAIDRWRSLPPTLRSAPGDRWAACLSAHLVVRPATSVTSTLQNQRQESESHHDRAAGYAAAASVETTKKHPRTVIEGR